jgi:hypothetical protein
VVFPSNRHRENDVTRAEIRVLAASIEYQRAKSDLTDAEREFNEAVTAVRLLGMHLDPKVMEVCGDAPSVTNGARGGAEE